MAAGFGPICRCLTALFPGVTLRFKPQEQESGEKPLSKVLNEAEVASYRRYGHHFPIDALSGP
jgi:hypothetical protein